MPKRESFPTARFWIRYKGSPVKLSMVFCSMLEVYDYQRTDEGFESSHDRYEYDDDFEHDPPRVRCYHQRRARDCDGLIEQWTEYYCTIDMLKAGYMDTTYCLQYPEWQRVNGRQRDHSAEAAGY
jgi:hypothetical protein